MNILKVLLDFNAELNLFEYGIPVKGIIRDVSSENNYNKFYKYLSPKEFKKYGGGICWDYVSYQTDFLSKHNIQFKNYFIWNPKRIDEEGTHTITVAYDDSNRKYYYIESSFKSICGVYESDRIEDIWNFVIQNMELSYYEIYRYEFCRIYGASMLEYMEWMVENAKLEKKGNPIKSKVKLKNYQTPPSFPNDIRTENEKTLESFIDYCNEMIICESYTQSINIDISTVKSIINKIKSKVNKDSKEPTGNQNCMLCTWCLESQIRGIEILPRPVYSPRDVIFNFEGYVIVKSPIKLKVRNKNDVISTVLNAGNNSRFYVHINWKGSDGGHEFIIMNIHNKIFVADAQSGTFADIKSKDGSYYFSNINYKNSFLVRMDDKELNEDILRYNDSSYILEWDEEKDIPYLNSSNQDYVNESFTYSNHKDLKRIDNKKIKYMDIHDKRARYYLLQDEYSKKIMDHIMKYQNGEIIIDVERDVIIGRLFVWNNNDKKNEGYINSVYIDKDYRGYGFSNKLVEDAVNKYNGYDLCVDKDNRIAINLYKNHGFVIDKSKNDESTYYMILKSRLKTDSVVESSVASSLESFINYCDVMMIHTTTENPNKTISITKLKRHNKEDVYHGKY